MANARTRMDDPAAQPLPARRWAWGVCWLLFASTVLNYMDRQAIALVSPQVQAEFRIGDETFGWVLAAFYLVYALFQLPAGFLADRVRPDRLYPAAVAFWSLAGIATAFAPTLGPLILCRAILGLGESFNWPCALKITAHVLPPGERSLGNGIFNSGAAVGAVITPLIVPVIAVRFGWRTAFVVVGLLGFAWTAVWLLVMRDPGSRSLEPEAQPAVSDEPTRSQPVDRVAWLAVGGLAGLALLVGALGYRTSGATGIWLGVATLMIGLLILVRALPLRLCGSNGWLRALADVVRLRRFWVLLITTISINTCWHFLVGWLPRYLNSERSWTALAELVEPFVPRDAVDRSATARFLVSSVITACIFVAADLGNLIGGWASRRLSNRGLRPGLARWRVMMLAVLAISSGVWVGQTRNEAATIALISLMAMGAAAYMANYFAFCQEVDPGSTGLIVGILGGIGNLFAAAILPYAGWVKDHTGSFDSIFFLVGLSPVLGLAALALAWGRDEPAPEPS